MLAAVRGLGRSPSCWSSGGRSSRSSRCRCSATAPSSSPPRSAWPSGLGMFSAIAFMPTFLQMSSGLSAANSGLLMLPMTGGIILTIQGSARLHPADRPVQDLHRRRRRGDPRRDDLDDHAVRRPRSLWTVGGMFFVLGAGLGLIMQNVVLAAQNAVAGRPDRHRHLDEQLLPRGRRHPRRRGLRDAVHQPAGRQPGRRAVRATREQAVQAGITSPDTPGARRR